MAHSSEMIFKSHSEELRSFLSGFLWVIGSLHDDDFSPYHWLLAPPKLVFLTFDWLRSSPSGFLYSAGSLSLSIGGSPRPVWL